jgi:hypothetical protein
MPAERNLLESVRPSRLAALAPSPSLPGDTKSHESGEEASCAAFGFLRGLHERAQMIEFRFRVGNTEAFPYSWLGPIRFNPSVGLLLRFTGDVVTLVLIRGSNLDAPVNTGAVNLIEHGIERHRVTWVSELDDAEIRQVGEGGPTIDRIEVAEFETQAELCAWLKMSAPEFLR